MQDERSQYGSQYHQSKTLNMEALKNRNIEAIKDDKFGFVSFFRQVIRPLGITASKKKT